MTTNFTFNNGGTVTDFDDVFIRKSAIFPVGLWAFGQDIYGQIGDGTVTNKSTPVTIMSSTLADISSSYANSAIIKQDGSLFMCGINTYGECGTGDVNVSKLVFTQVGSSYDWKQVASGDYHTVAVKTDGTLWSWGKNDVGQMGNSTTINASIPTKVGSSTNWAYVSSGFQFSAGLKSDGTLWTWGDNSYGQIGDGTLIKKSSPVQTIAGGTDWKQLSCGDDHVMAIKTDGTLWGWGYNTYGQIGDGTSVNKSSPVQIAGGGTNWKQLSTYNGDVSSAIKTDGTLWLWGYAAIYGALGDGSNTNKSSPVQTTAGGTNWLSVSNGYYHTAAVKTDGTLWAWGQGTYGQLGNSTTGNKISPVQVGTLTSWKSVRCGSYHTFAIK